jgi:peptidoglycan hydrolase CwlO-like protein
MATTTNYPSASPAGQSPKKDYRGLIIGLLAVGLLGTWGYLLWNNNRNDQLHSTDQQQIAKVSDEKSELQRSFDATLVRLDSVSGNNNELQGQLTEKTTELGKMKNEIRTILNNKNATQKELNRARALIAEMNEKVAHLEEDVARLTQQNETLTVEKTQLTSDKDKLTSDLQTTSTAKEELEKKVDVASTLNASNIAVTPVDEKKGGKEKITTTAKKVDKLVISFDVDNRIAQSGQTEVYVCITGPDGKPVAAPSLGSGTFTTREEGEKAFTAKVPVEVEAGKRKPVQFAWKHEAGSDFQRGNYKIEIFHNGFKIGEGVRELKKGGLFG